MKKNTPSHIKSTAASLCFASLGLAPATGFADPIVGTMGFAGQFQLDSSSSYYATKAVAWLNPTVGSDTGAFSSIPSGTSATFAAPFLFDSTTTNQNALLVSYDSQVFTMDMLNVSITSQGGIPGVTGFIVVDGQGLLSSSGYDSTPCHFSLICQDPSISRPNIFTFSASITAVPEPSTLALAALGGLGSLGLIRRRK